MHPIYRFTCLFLCVLLTGCTQRFQDTNATIKEAFFGFDNIELTPEHVDNLPYASAYARINDSHRIFLVLAYAEKNPLTGTTQLKWMSSDKAMIVTENGRIVKTLSLPKANLVELSSSPTLSANNKHWQTRYDWQPNYSFGHQASVESRLVKTEPVSSLLWNKNTQLVKEVVTFSDSKQSVENYFWIDDQGVTVKSSQWVVPEQLHVELEILKPFVIQSH